jgi:hypothetical protein
MAQDLTVSSEQLFIDRIRCEMDGSTVAFQYSAVAAK